MALSDPYISLEEYKLGADVTDDEHDALISDALDAVSRYIDRDLGRFFSKDDSDQSRIYVVGEGQRDPNGQWVRLSIDDLSAAPTSIKIDEDLDGDFTDETALATTDFDMWPRNALLGPEPQPYTAIYLTSFGDWGKWTAGQRVEVTGKFGWPSVPKAIKLATFELTKMLLLHGPRGMDRVNESFDVTLGQSDTSRQFPEHIKNKYRRRFYV